MRGPRIKARGEGFYHVVSRIVQRCFLLDDREKGILLGMVRASAEFSGVEVFTYAFMDNHFHLLVRVPGKTEVGDAELERRIRALYGPERSGRLFAQWRKWEEEGAGRCVEEAKARYRARMHDLSQFCKTFKETFTQDFNRRHGGAGTIWEGRFWSLLLEGAGNVLMPLAGYIHLNPVRAGIVDEPEEARFAGYGAACRGDAKAQKGLARLVARVFGLPDADWEMAREICREVMEGRFRVEAGDDDANADNNEGETGAGKGRLLHGMLRQRQTGFLRGGALGSPQFLENMAGVLPMRSRGGGRRALPWCPGAGLAAAFAVRKAS